MQAALLMEQEVGPARGARWTVGQGGRLSVCLSSSYSLLALKRCLSVPCTLAVRGAVSGTSPINVQEGFRGVALAAAAARWCPWLCGASPGGAGPPPPAAAPVPSCGPAWRALAPGQELSPSRLWGNGCVKCWDSLKDQPTHRSDGRFTPGSQGTITKRNE